MPITVKLPNGEFDFDDENQLADYLDKNPNIYDAQDQPAAPAQQAMPAQAQQQEAKPIDPFASLKKAFPTIGGALEDRAASDINFMDSYTGGLNRPVMNAVGYGVSKLAGKDTPYADIKENIGASLDKLTKENRIPSMAGSLGGFVAPGNIFSKFMKAGKAVSPANAFGQGAIAGGAFGTTSNIEDLLDENKRGDAMKNIGLNALLTSVLTPIGEKAINYAGQKLTGAPSQKAFNDILGNISGKFSKETPSQAGQGYLKDITDYSKATSKEFSDMASKFLSGGEVKPKATRETILGLLQNIGAIDDQWQHLNPTTTKAGYNPQTQKEILDLFNSTLEPANKTLEGFQALKSNFGSKLGWNERGIDMPEKTLMDLYSSMKKDLLSGVESTHGKIPAKIAEGVMEKYSQSKSGLDSLLKDLAVGNKKVDKIAPDEMYNQVMSGINKYPGYIDKLKTTLSPQSFDTFKGQVINDIFKSNVDNTGYLNIESVANKIKKFDPDVL